MVEPMLYVDSIGVDLVQDGVGVGLVAGSKADYLEQL